MKLLDLKVGYYISCPFRCVEDGVIWVLIGVFGTVTKDGRKQLREELGAVRGIWGDPWCIGGDFNFIQFPS